METIRCTATRGHSIRRPSPSPPVTPRTLVIEDPDTLGPHLAAWDDLAVVRGRPFCAPAWMLAWWREARTGDARLRVVLVLDGAAELVGVGPFFAQVRFGLAEMRLLGAGFSHRIGPLARPGAEVPVAGALAGALATMRPRPASVVFEGIDLAEPWPELLAAQWPGRRPRLRTDLVMPAPVLRMTPSFDDWLSRRERHFRKEARRTERRLLEKGAEPQLAHDGEAVADLMRLHHARWAGRGGSSIEQTAARVIAAAASELADRQRLLVALLRTARGPIAAELVVRAGDTATFWGGGFDPDWARFAPGTQTMLVALRAVGGLGATRADLGGGDHAYKQRLADANEPLAWRTLFPRGVRYPLIRLVLAPKHARLALRGAGRRLPAGARERLRTLVRVLR